LKEICVLSGKGGAGKSSITASMAILIKERMNIVLGDCDVDAPNLGLITGRENVRFNCSPVEASERASFVAERCKGRRKCVNVCRFRAIEWNGKLSVPEINALLCEGCGACEYICPDNAIEVRRVESGQICSFRSKYGFHVVTGRLKPGERGSGRIVDEVRKLTSAIGESNESELAIFDSAAGIGCPVLSSVKGVDHAVIITEPTGVSMGDLRRALNLVNHFRVPKSIIINKWDINPDIAMEIEEMAADEGIPVLGRIPYDLGFVDALVNLTPAVLHKPQLRKHFSGITDNLLSDTGLI